MPKETHANASGPSVKSASNAVNRIDMAHRRRCRLGVAGASMRQHHRHRRWRRVVARRRIGSTRSCRPGRRYRDCHPPLRRRFPGVRALSALRLQCRRRRRAKPVEPPRFPRVLTTGVARRHKPRGSARKQPRVSSLADRSHGCRRAEGRHRHRRRRPHPFRRCQWNRPGRCRHETHMLAGARRRCHRRVRRHR